MSAMDMCRARDSIALGVWSVATMRKLTAAIIGLLGAATAGCVSTQELPLAPNMVRLDTHASGGLFIGQATGQTMRRAAEVDTPERLQPLPA